MNIKKMFTTLSAMVVAVMFTLPNASVFAATYSQELQDAYNWAYSKGVTTMSPIDNANMYGAITRAEMAKMLSVYATEVLDMEPNTAAACTFSDIDSVKGDLHDYIIESCELGIMGQGITAFRPYDTISRAEFGTALSRVLWGNQYEGGTPYYAKHLDALKAAGIMNQIANAESTKEIRGYVMLMLMRSEGNDAVVDCDDPMTVIACTTDTAACPAACKEAGEKEDTVVRAGDLAVTATASTDRKIIVAASGAVSDTDTLTFKTSEEVTISKVTLERYGFSDGSKVVSGVRLEDADGNVIAESKELNNKDQVTLTIKKDYRNVDGTLKATIVVETKENSNTAAGGTMWFKVTDVQSTAKNLNVDDYKPYTYDLVVYGGTEVELSRYGNDKDYNYEAGEMYEVARFRVKASNSAVLINGFTLTNNLPSASGDKVDLQKYLDKVEVTANGEKVSAKYSANKDDQLVISLDKEYRLAAKWNVSFVVSLSLADFEDYRSGVKFEVAANDLKAIEEKTETRITVKPSTTETWAAHLFRGGKIKLSDSRLSDVEAAAGSVNKVIGEWEISLGEPVKLSDFKVVASTGNVIEAMTLVVAGEEYDASHDADYKEWTFSKVVIEKSGKVQFKVDLKEEVASGVNQVTFTINGTKAFDKSSFVGAKYEELKNEAVNQKDVSGSVKLVALKVQAAKASLENTLSKSKAIEFLADKGDRKVVFDGTYTAKKGDITLTSFWFEWITGALTNYLALYVYIDGEEVGNVDTFKADGSTSVERFSDVKVKKDETVKVKVEAEISSDIEGHPYPTKTTFDLYLQGEDADGNDAGKGSDSVAPISVKSSGSVVIPSGEGSNTVKLKGRGETIAYFVVKPANGAEWIYLDKLELTIAWSGAGTTASDIKVNIWDDKDIEPSEGLIYKPNTELPKEGVVVEVILKDEAAGTYTVTANVNSGSATKTFNRKFVDALVKVEKQENKGAYTKYTLSVEKYDDTIEVKDFDLLAGSGSVLATPKATVSNGDTVSADNTENSRSITKMTYKVGSETITLDKGTYEDFFVAEEDGEDLRVFPSK